MKASKLLSKAAAVLLSMSIIGGGVCGKAPATVNLPLTAFAATEQGVYGEMFYESDGTSVSIVGCNIDALGDIIIPANIGGLPVTKIEDGAFKRCRGITFVNIPATVTSIGNSSFQQCSSLTSVLFAGPVTSIGDSAFFGCTSLTEIEIPDTVTTIGATAFGYYTALASITIPDSVTSIGDYAFRDCENLLSAEVPDTVSMGEEVFYQCSKLNIVECPGIYSHSDGDSIRITGFEAEVTHIHNGTYYEIDIPEYIDGQPVREIASFSGLNAANKVKIPQTVTTINPNYGGASTEYFDVDDDNPTFYDIDGVIFSNDKVLVSYPSMREGDYVIPDTVQVIGDYAFAYCDDLYNLEIPNSVKKIGKWAFSFCLNLDNVTIPESVDIINEEAFNIDVAESYIQGNLESITILNPDCKLADNFIRT